MQPITRTMPLGSYQRTEEEQRWWDAMSPWERRATQQCWKSDVATGWTFWYNQRVTTLAEAEAYFWCNERARRQARADEKARRQAEWAARQAEADEAWRLQGGPKPRHLRRRGPDRRRVGCDTRRYNAAGKLIGGHHGYDHDDCDGNYYRERRANKLAAYYYLTGLELEDFENHISMPHIRYDSHRFKPQY